MTVNVDTDEIAHFDQLATRWWKVDGEMGALHVVNGPRVRYIERVTGGLAGKRVLDVGCGGGILTEALAKAGAVATGIDLALAALDVARAHAVASSLTIDYRLIAAEVLAAAEPARFDVVCCLEMLEHVPDPGAVVAAIGQLVKPGGHAVFSTINRNPKSYALMILGAEYLTGIVPRGTHDYGQFIKPSELDRWARAAGLVPRDVTGLRYNPLLKSASLAPRDLDVNYLLHAVREASPE